MRPGEAILRILAEAATTLERSFKGRGAEEAADEYQQYWHSERHAWSLVPRLGRAGTRTLDLYKASRSDRTITILSDSGKISGWEAGAPVRGVYVVDTDGRIGPGATLEQPKDLATLHTWWEAQAALSHVHWKTIEQKLLADELCFVFAANAMIGFRIPPPRSISSGVKGGRIREAAIPRMMQLVKDKLGLQRWSASDCSLERITSRNVPKLAGLASKKVGLVGCGTIGSHLARMMMQSGAGSNQLLYLFDNDHVAPGNLGRHLLNLENLGQNKAKALAAELQRFHPSVQIKAVDADAVASWLLRKKCDIIIDATGDWNVQTNLNELFLEDRGTHLTALLHCWVFANGVGVQSFLNLGDDKACFRCLKPEFAGNWRYPAAQNGIETEFTPATCGDGTFAAFSVDAPVMAAALANRAILDWARGEPGQRLRTVVIDLVDGRNQKPVSPDPAANCPACAPMRAAR